MKLSTAEKGIAGIAVLTAATLALSANVLAQNIDANTRASDRNNIQLPGASMDSGVNAGARVQANPNRMNTQTGVRGTATPRTDSLPSGGATTSGSTGAGATVR